MNCDMYIARFHSQYQGLEGRGHMIRMIQIGVYSCGDLGVLLCCRELCAAHEGARTLDLLRYLACHQDPPPCCMKEAVSLDQVGIILRRGTESGHRVHGTGVFSFSLSSKVG
jgi:hypothetical protein